MPCNISHGFISNSGHDESRTVKWSILSYGFSVFQGSPCWVTLQVENHFQLIFEWNVTQSHLIFDICLPEAVGFNLVTRHFWWQGVQIRKEGLQRWHSKVISELSSELCNQDFCLDGVQNATCPWKRKTGVSDIYWVVTSFSNPHFYRCHYSFVRPNITLSFCHLFLRPQAVNIKSNLCSAKQTLSHSACTKHK